MAAENTLGEEPLRKKKKPMILSLSYSLSLLYLTFASVNIDETEWQRDGFLTVTCTKIYQ